MQWTYPLPYSVISFFLVQAVNDGKTCTIEDIKQGIYDRNLSAFFKENQVKVDPSLLTPELYAELIDLADTQIDYKLLSGAKNGYLLLVAYLLEFIQRNTPNRHP
jgi:hypothetical protein